MLSNYIFLIGIICCVKSVYSNGFYTIVGSKQIRPNSEYTVSVTLHNHRGTAKIRLSIVNGNNYVKTQEITAQADRTHVVKIPTDNMVAGSSGYKLVAEGISGINFRKETPLHLNEKSFSIFMQTDKGMYKAKDLVRFRVIVLDENTKPVQIKGDVNVFITDGNKNLIKQWEKVELNRGVFSSNIKLSEYPVLGNWIIKVEYLGEVKEKSFEVLEYVLPTFEVVIDGSEHQLYSDNIIRATISAKYTFGQPVRGEAVVTINAAGSGQPTLLQRIIKIEKKEPIEFRIADLKLSSQVQRDFEIKVVFTEELTDHSQSGLKTVTLHTDRYKIVTVNPNNEYKPYLPFQLTVKVTKYDETPVSDAVNQLEILYGPSHQRRTDNVEPYHIENGIVTTDFTISDESPTIHVYAKYLGKEYSLGHFTKANSGIGEYLRAKIPNGTPIIIGQRISIDVESTEPMSRLTYQVLGRGNVLDSNTIIVRNRRTHQLPITVTAAMVPKAQVIIFYVKNGEIVSTKLELELDDNFSNKMEVSSTIEEAKPGDSVEVVVKTERDSFIGLLGIDQSALILKSGFDISRQSVFDDLDEYNIDYNLGGSTVASPIIPAPSASLHDAYKDFIESGAIIISNVHQFSVPAPVEEIHNTPAPIRPLRQMPVASARVVPYFDDYGGGSFSRWPQSGGGGGGGGGGIRWAGSSFTDINLQMAPDLRVSARESIAETLVRPAPQEILPIEPEVSKFDLNQVNVRKLFPETWIWDDITDSFVGTRILNKTIPDSITSWIITGFSVNSNIGLGMTEKPTKLQVFQPFFVSLDLPYSIKRGETVAIKVVVFNYMSTTVNAEVTLYKQNDEFEFDEPSGLSINALSRTKKISIGADDGTALSFLIRSNIVGQITIKVSAHTSNAGDIIERILPVEPEGDTKYQNQALFIDLRSRSSYQTSVSVLIPSNAVPDSSRIEVSVTGDIMGTTLTNLDSLIRLPYGCGEQNMLNFVPNIVVIDYLTSTGQLTLELESKTKGFMESGYQRQLGYARQDGSFSAFGSRDSRGSTWLTAYVIRSFTQAKQYISIDLTVIDKAVQWLMSVQTSSGNFPEVGRILDRSMQGGSGQGIALTAYTLISILEIRNNQSQYKSAIDKAVNYLLNAAKDSNIPLYDLALITYALQLANHSSKDNVYERFQLRAQQVGDKKWWGSSSSSNSKDVEITSYGLLATLLAGLDSDGLSIVRWLLSKRSDLGGYGSTQETVLGITALAAYSKITTSRGSNVQISIEFNGEERQSTVKASNALVLQQYLLPKSVQHVSISATGIGFAVVEVSHRYNVNVNERKPGFTLIPTIGQESTVDHLLLKACGSYISNNGQPESNMAVMEIELPSGYKADLDNFSAIRKTKNVKRVESENGDTKVVIYFDSFDTEQICPTISAFRSHKVANIKPVPVKLYDYYDNDLTACTFYQVQQQSICQICEGTDCGRRC